METARRRRADDGSFPRKQSFDGGGTGNNNNNNHEKVKPPIATPPQEDLSLSPHLLVAHFVVQCVLHHALRPYFTSASDGWDLTDSDRIAAAAAAAAAAAGADGADGGGGVSGVGGASGVGVFNVNTSRDIAVFTAALFLSAMSTSVMNAMFTPSTTRAQLFQNAAYINACAAYTYICMYTAGELISHTISNRTHPAVIQKNTKKKTFASSVCFFASHAFVSSLSLLHRRRLTVK